MATALWPQRAAAALARASASCASDSGSSCRPAAAPKRCAYCFLQTTGWLRFNPHIPPGMIHTNGNDTLHGPDTRLADPVPKTLTVGELQDELVSDETSRRIIGKPLTHWLIPPLGAQRGHRLIFLTKSTQVDHALEPEATWLRLGVQCAARRQYASCDAPSAA